MIRELAEMLRETISGDAELQALGVKAFYNRAPVGTVRPYVIYADEDQGREENSTDEFIQRRTVSFTLVHAADDGEALESVVEPGIRRLRVLLEDQTPSIGDNAEIMRAAVLSDDDFGYDDDGEGDVVVGVLTMEYTLQRKKGV